VSQYNRPQLTVSFSTGSGESSYGLDVVSLSTGAGDNFTVTLQGSLQSSNTAINEQILQCKDYFYGMGYAAAPNLPVPGGVGDIQANAANQLAPGGQYIYAPSIITPQYTSSATDYSFSPSGLVNARPSFDRFPTQRGSVNWALNGYNLYGEDFAPSQILLTIATNRPVRMSRTVNIVCPVITSSNVSGCYLCAQGATVTLFAHSRCSAGAAVATSDNDDVTISTPSVVLQTSDTPVAIRVNSATPNVEFTITLTSGGYSSSILVQGTLIQQALIGFVNGTFIHNSTSDSLDLSGLSNWLLSLPEWARALIITAITVASIVGAIVLSCFAYKGFKSYKAAQRQAVYEKLEDKEQEQRLKKAQEKLAADLEPNEFSL
jgi:hypothetical protein